MDFQKLLLNVGNSLSNGEVQALTFLCTDLLSRSLTSVESAAELFSGLANQGHLCAERPQLLTELLLTIQRTRLVRELGLNRQASDNNRLISPYRKLLYNLSEDITDNELKEVKFLLDGKIKRRKLDENVTTLEVFLEMEKMDLMNSTDLNLLEDIVQQICPVLKEKIKHFKAQQEPHTRCATQETGRPRAASSPLELNQDPQPLHSGRPSSCEFQGLSRTSLAENNMSSFNNSVDPPYRPGNIFHNGMTHALSGLSIASVRNDAFAISPPTQNEDKTTRTSSTNSEFLETYPMTAAKKGVCFIVSNHDFTKSKPYLNNRDGTEIDEECLQKVFEWLGFEVEIQRDCTTAQMRSLFRGLGSRDHSRVNCVVCCVLSHGLEGGVYGVDGLCVDLKELTEPFNGLNCPSLAEKPKLFFIQACQGNKEQAAVYVEADGPAPRGAICSDAKKSLRSIPSEADFLLAMATVSSFVSYRERKNGTWFIQSLCQNLVEMVPRGHNLMSILTKVNADVSQRSWEKKQMPQPSFSLTKNVVFPIPTASAPSLALTVYNV